MESQFLKSSRKRKLSFGELALGTGNVNFLLPKAPDLLEITPLYQRPSYSQSPDYRDVTTNCDGSTRFPLPLVLGRQTLSLLWWKHCPNRCGVHRATKALRQDPFYWTDCCDSCYCIRGVQQPGKTALSLRMMDVDTHGTCQLVARHTATIQLVDRTGRMVSEIPQSGPGIYLLLCDRRETNGPCHYMYFQLRWIDAATDEAETSGKPRNKETLLVEQPTTIQTLVLQDSERAKATRDLNFSQAGPQSMQMQSAPNRGDIVRRMPIVTPGQDQPPVRSRPWNSAESPSSSGMEHSYAPSVSGDIGGQRYGKKDYPKPVERTQLSGVIAARRLQFDHFSQIPSNDVASSASESLSQESGLLHLPIPGGEETQLSLTMQEATQPLWQRVALFSNVQSKDPTLCRTMKLDEWKQERDASVPESYRRCVIDLILYRNGRSKPTEGDNDKCSSGLWLPTILEDDCTLDLQSSSRPLFNPL